MTTDPAKASKPNFWVITSALFSHWRRHKIQAITLIVGLAAATALWTAVQALNSHARTSYATAASAVAGANRPALVSVDGEPLDQSVFAGLRRAGLDVTPVVEGRFLHQNTLIELTGIDPFTAQGDELDVPKQSGQNGSTMLRFIQPPGLLFAAPETAVLLTGFYAPLPLEDRPTIEVNASLKEGTAIGDIAVVQRLTKMEGRLTKLLLPAGVSFDPSAIPESWKGTLKLEEKPQQVDLKGLTDSFHLNLTAFGLLCFLVGLFIVYSAIGLAIEDRLSSIRTLRICGISRRRLLGLMVFEMVCLAVVAGTIGVVLGYITASLLLPDIAASLRGLYGARIGGALSLDASWWIGGIAISVLGVLAAALGGFFRVSKMSLLETKGTEAWRAKQDKVITIKASLALIFLSLALIFYGFGEGLFAAFGVMAGVLLAAAFLLPLVLKGLLAIGAKASTTPLSRWFWADARQQLTGLSLALMALMLALGTNIGVSGMVSGFRGTFDAFLEERLSADLYLLAASGEQGRAIMDWAESQPEIAAILPITSATSQLDGQPVNITGFEDHAIYRDTWQFLVAVPNAWDAAAVGNAVLINEQLARRQNKWGDTLLTLETNDGSRTFSVAGVYSDYGNPRMEVRMSNQTVIRVWPDARQQRFAIITSAGAQVRSDIVQQFDLPSSQIIDQAALKNFSRGIFEKTFTISDALSALTLGVAAIAMFTSLLALSGARISGVAPLWAMGVPRRTLALYELMKILLLSFLTAVAAIPLGIAITWCLVAVVNVEAFGWRLPLHLFPSQWAVVGMLGLLSALVAAIYPTIKLQRTPPALLSKVFANDH